MLTAIPNLSIVPARPVFSAGMLGSDSLSLGMSSLPARVDSVTLGATPPSPNGLKAANPAPVWPAPNPAPTPPAPAPALDIAPVTLLQTAPSEHTRTLGQVWRQLDSEGLSLDRLGAMSGPRQQVRQIVDSLKDFASPPYSGYLVTGDSGSGKSALMKAMAGELAALSVPVLAVQGGDVHSGRDLEELFASAAEQACANPRRAAVVVLENVDVLTRVRSNTQDQSSAAAHALLGSFLAQTEAAANRKDCRLVILGTTSRKDTMDWTGAARLPGEINIQSPTNPAERLEVLNSLAAQRHIDTSVAGPEAWQDLAQATRGANPGSLGNILTLAEAHARQNGRAGLEEADLIAARLENAYGPVIHDQNQDWFFRISSCHELGHAVIRHVFQEMAEEGRHPDHRPLGIDVVSLEARGGASAFVSLKSNDNPAKTLEYYFAEISSNYGGRAAEYQFGDKHLSAGPGNDLKFATSLASEAVRQSGMGRSTGAVSPGASGHPDSYEARAAADETQLLASADQVAMSVVHFYRDFIGSLADELVTRRSQGGSLVLTGRELTARLKAWEQADPERGRLLTNLKNYIRTTMDSLRPAMPAIYDPATGSLRAA